MNFETCFNKNSAILMEGALGERLKREYNILFDDKVAMAALIYNLSSTQAMKNIFCEYVKIAEKYKLPFIATTPTRRANKERVMQSNYDERIIEDNVHFLQQIKKSTNIDMMELYEYFTPKIFGGCCGTDSTHMEEIAKRLKR